MGYLILIMIILFLTTILFAYLLYKSAEKNRKTERVINQLTDINDKTVTVENVKTKIREKYNDQEHNINNGTESIILPNDSTCHNHTHNSPCGITCPLFTGKKRL